MSRKIKNVAEIENDIIDYTILNGRIAIETEKVIYEMDYTPENEDIVYSQMETDIEDLADLEDINEEISLLGSGFGISTCYTIAMIVLAIIFKNFLPLFFALPSVVVQTNTLRSLILSNKMRRARKIKVEELESLLKKKDIEKLQREIEFEYNNQRKINVDQIGNVEKQISSQIENIEIQQIDDNSDGTISIEEYADQSRNGNYSEPLEEKRKKFTL